MTTFFYFAYGSNMLTERLRDRCPSSVPIGVARAAGFDIAITKISKDRSGKATLRPASKETSQETFGVVFEIHECERKLLDHAEGPGYNRDDAFVVTLSQNNQHLPISTYIARDDHLAPGLLPFCWYRALIIAGAEQHNLPKDHIASLGALQFRQDPDTDRLTRKEAHNALESAGFAHLLP